MKKILPILSLALILFACKKTNKTDVQLPEKKYDVTFSVSDFNQEVVALGKTSSRTSAVGDTLKNYADVLAYRIYNSSGVQVNAVDQQSSSTTFGTIADKLPSGTYSVFIGAAKVYISTSSNSLAYGNAAFYGSSPWNDTFASRFSLTVGTAVVSQSVRLSREVGGIEVTLQDAIPSNAAKVSIVFQNEYNYLYLNGSGGWGASTTKEFSLMAPDIGVKNKTFLMYVGNTFTTSSVIIRAYDSANGLIAEKTVPNVRVYKNKKTLLTGTLFPGTANPSVGFTVTVNPIWDVSGTPITF